MTPAAYDGGGESGVDRSVRVTVPEKLAGEAGAVLMDVLGPFEERSTEPGAQGSSGRVTLVFYPPADGPSTSEELLSLLPDAFAGPGVLQVETGNVSRDWVEGWRAHFVPIVVGSLRIRPPWEPPAPAGVSGAGGTSARVDVVINPGLGFGTGLHPTTRGVLMLLQRDAGAAVGPLVDVGTGSGILAIAAAKLGWAPVIAFDNDPAALASARENAEANGVGEVVQVCAMDATDADERWFQGATVVANMTLEPVSLLVRRLSGAGGRPRSLIVSGILAGDQEEQLLLTAHDSGFVPAHRLYEEEWVSIDLRPGSRPQ